jgi:hypothetical protein
MKNITYMDQTPLHRLGDHRSRQHLRWRSQAPQRTRKTEIPGLDMAAAETTARELLEPSARSGTSVAQTRMAHISPQRRPLQPCYAHRSQLRPKTFRRPAVAAGADPVCPHCEAKSSHMRVLRSCRCSTPMASIRSLESHPGRRPHRRAQGTGPGLRVQGTNRVLTESIPTHKQRRVCRGCNRQAQQVLDQALRGSRAPGRKSHMNCQ